MHYYMKNPNKKNEIGAVSNFKDNTQFYLMNAQWNEHALSSIKSMATCRNRHCP